jgi:hypothetical protein
MPESYADKGFPRQKLRTTALVGGNFNDSVPACQTENANDLSLGHDCCTKYNRLDHKISVTDRD